ncbi:putative G-protein coupled receptor 158 [Acipenser ruthenus]|uniref:Putative G-protein coupled receptor 158 n=1 Tax=Acipenser ruthenus TaxID=7906 RepID=A0A444U275_ACIRT|nr:putative G-protein coupled receptor 158 [Acipenser ruthenus]
MYIFKDEKPWIITFKGYCYAFLHKPKLIYSFDFVFSEKAKENPVSGSPYEEKLSDGVHECLPCRAGCSYCTDESPCYAQEDGYLRISILSFHAVCMLMDFISMLVVYHFRRNKSIRASGLVLLETILFGGLLLYFPPKDAVRVKVKGVVLCYMPRIQFLLARSNQRDDTAAEAYEDDLDLGRSGSYLNSSIASAWSDHSLDPDDIREELKKLYSQLEIYKRKKMVANNPHLQKKRSSKKGLGRTIMRRITEIPETVSRQCSREDKELGDHTSARNSISTLRRNPFDPAHSSTKTKEESLKSKVFSIKKSHSSYDHVRNQSEDSSSPTTEKMEVSTTESSLLDTLMGKGKQEKKSTENIEAESTESLPLVCKSASAHNLTADKKPLHPRTSMLQKSLSVIASAKERTLGLTGKAPSLEENSRQQKGRESNKPHSEKSDHQQKNVASHAEEAKKSNKQGIMKPQGSSSQTSLSPDPGKTGPKDQFDVAEVCPWEVQDLPPTPPENKAQKHVSIAPMESISAHGSHAKGKSQNKQKATENLSSQIKQETQKNLDKSEICPWDIEEPQDLIEGSKPLANHQSVPALSKGEHSSKAQKAEICPWEFEEMVARGVEARQPEPDKIKQGGQKKNAFPVDVQGKQLLSNASQSNSSSQLPTPKKAEVCPWDYDTELSPNSDTTAAPTASLKTKDTTQKKKGLFSISKDKERGRDRDDEKGKAKSREKAVFTKGTQKPVGQSKLAEMCPWETESSLDTSTQERKSTLNELSAAKNKQADICPWEFEGFPDTKELDKNTCREKLNPNSKGGAAGQTRLAEPCKEENQAAEEQHYTSVKPCKEENQTAEEQHYTSVKPCKEENQAAEEQHYTSVKPCKEENQAAEEQHYTSVKPCKEENQATEEQQYTSVKPCKEENQATEEQQYTSVKPCKEENQATEEQHYTSVKPCKEENQAAEEQHYTSVKPCKEENQAAEEQHYTSVKPCKEENQEAEEQHYTSVKPCKEENQAAEEQHYTSVKPCKEENQAADEQH